VLTPGSAQASPHTLSIDAAVAPSLVLTPGSAQASPHCSVHHGAAETVVVLTPGSAQASPHILLKLNLILARHHQ